MAKYTAIIDVDEEQLKEITQLDDIEDGLDSELQWVVESGIYIEVIKKIEE